MTEKDILRFQISMYNAQLMGMSQRLRIAWLLRSRTPGTSDVKDHGSHEGFLPTQT